MGSTSRSPSRFYLLSYPRTGSNLLLKILNLESQPNISTGELDGGYFFMPADDMLIALPLRNKPITTWTPDELTQVQTCYTNCYTTMKSWILSQETQLHNSTFIKEHATFMLPAPHRSHLAFNTPLPSSPSSPSNPTTLPDTYLQTFLPTFLIRHPALAFPSYYRTIIQLSGPTSAADESYASLRNISLATSRQLYDLFVSWRDILPCPESSRGVWPIVLDAEDVISSPETVRRYAKILGLEEGRLRFEWERGVEGEGAHGVMRSTLVGSRGVDRSKAPKGVDVEVEMGKWVEEFGGRAAGEIKGLVEGAMGDYEYLRSRRLKVEG